MKRSANIGIVGPDSTDIERLAIAVSKIRLIDYPGGWPNAIELALIDAVLSIQARYGRRGATPTGVPAAVARYQLGEGDRAFDDLTRLSQFDPAELARALGNHQKTSGHLKAAAIVSAANRLVAVGVRHAKDFDGKNAAQRAAYVGVRGLGPVTWEYLGMNLGNEGVKADTWIRRFVAEAVGHSVEPKLAEALIKAVANKLDGVTATQLDHAIWAAASGRISA